MCGNKHQRRAARHGGLRGASYSNNGQQTAGGISAIIGAIQEIKLAGHGIDSRATMDTHYPTHAELDSQSQGVQRGVAYDYPSAVDEKKQIGQGAVNFEVLPSYEESTETRSQSSASSVSKDTPMHNAFEQNVRPQVTRSNTETAVLKNLEQFRTSLLEYRQGAEYSKKDAKRAAKNFVRDLREQELLKREGEKGYLACGERKQVRREVKPVKQMLKAAVKEARWERKGHC